MKKSRYSDEQIVRILCEADKAPIGDVAKRYGISEQSIYSWRKRFGEMGSNEVKHLKGLEQENARLKKLLAERDLEIDMGRARLAGSSQTSSASVSHESSAPTIPSGSEFHLEL